MMRVLYHLTVLPPKMPEAEAMSQEIGALRAHFGGELVYLNPNQYSPIYVPRLLFGLHLLKQLRAKEADHQIHQLYNPDPFPFPILRLLRRPAIYALSCGLGPRRPNVRFFNSLAAVTVYDERSFKRLRAWGVGNVALVRPGIDASRFTCSPLPLGSLRSLRSLRSEVRLMVGSSPWSQAQFRTKGVDALLAAAQRAPELRLTFLWRGVLAEEMERRVRERGLGKQVVVLNRRVDVNQVLANVHASITLAADPAIVRSYPHSLMDSLAAGKPVLVSRAIPMSDHVEQAGCGVVVESVTPAGVLAAIETLIQEYDKLQKAAQDVGQRDFTQQAMIDSYAQVYEHVLELTERRP
jgi:glycosyltransferase involved in cell wall biosynthesis